MSRRFIYNSFLFFIILGLTLGNFLIISPTLAASQLVKSDQFDTVYYIDETGVRHPFPNLITYQSWYGNDFSQVQKVSNSFLEKYPIGKNITMRPGKNLVKIRTAPKVYAVTPGAVLREIKNESVAAGIYGEAWAKRVIDIPDVFFDNYLIGKVVDKETEVPDGVLFQDSQSKTYYYKSDDLLRPFNSLTSVLANRFVEADKVVLPYTYLFYQRTRSISGFDANVFNPVATATVDTRDCANQELKAAVIFLSAGNYKADELSKLEMIKNKISDRFDWVTWELAKIDMSYPTVTMTDDGQLTNLRDDGSREIKNEVLNTFFDQHQDVFDFVFIYTNFIVPLENQNELAHFTPVANKLRGNKRDSINWSNLYGSRGKLKGVITMGNINKYNIDTQAGINEALNLVMHEILHQWGAYITFIDNQGKENYSLLREKDYQHWSYYAGWLSPLGGSGWVDNGDGTFTSQLSQLSDSNLRQYSSLDLYLMGLIPAQVMDPVFYVVPDEPGTVANTIAGTAKWVSIDQIVKANGKVQCSIY